MTKSKQGNGGSILMGAGAMCIIAIFIVAGVSYFAVSLPAQVQYNKAFGGQISITIDQPSISGMSTNLMKLWLTMNATFPGDHTQIYNSYWYWDQTPDNTIASEDRYFRSEIGRLNNYTAQYNAYVKSGQNIVIGLPLTDWYDKVTNNSRHELQRNGGLDWAIQGAWYLKYAPAAYFLPYYVAAISAILFLAGVILLWVGNSRSQEYY